MILGSVKEAILFDWAVVIISLILLYCSYFIFLKEKSDTCVVFYIPGLFFLSYFFAVNKDSK